MKNVIAACRLPDLELNVAYCVAADYQFQGAKPGREPESPLYTCSGTTNGSRGGRVSSLAASGSLRKRSVFESKLSVRPVR